MALDSTERRKIDVLMEDLNLLGRYVEELTTFFPLPLCFVSPLGVILEVNPTFEGMFGFAFYDLIGKTVEEITSKENAEYIRKTTLEHGALQGKEFVFFTKDKKEIPVSAFAKVRQDESGNVLGFFLSVFDLIGIKKAENQIASQVRELEMSRKALLNILEDIEESRKIATEERDKTKAIIENLADGLIVFDDTYHITSLNPEAEKFLAAKSGEIVGMSLADMMRLPLFANIPTLSLKDRATGFSRKIIESRALALEASLIPMRAGENHTGSVFVLHDITREKEIEKIKTDFVSLAAHQLRTPVSAIKWTLRMLLDGDMGRITKAQKEFLSKTYASNERMISLINNLLNTARIEEGKLTVERAPFDLAALVKSIASLFREDAQKRNILLEVVIAKEGSFEVIGDKENIRFVVQNLLENALHYTLAKGTVHISLTRKRERVLCEIRDNGIGIPETEQSRIFEKFFRAEHARMVDTEGSGLGLYMAKNIIEAHGGEIRFTSKEGEGSIFSFFLRAYDGAKEKVAGSGSSSYHTPRRE